MSYSLRFIIPPLSFEDLYTALRSFGDGGGVERLLRTSARYTHARRALEA